MLAEMVAWQPPRAGRPAGSISSRSIAVSRNRLFLVGLLPRRQVGTQGWSVAVEQRDVCGALTPLQPTRPTVNERSIDVLPMPGNLICYRHVFPPAGIDRIEMRAISLATSSRVFMFAWCAGRTSTSL